MGNLIGDKLYDLWYIKHFGHTIRDFIEQHEKDITKISSMELFMLGWHNYDAAEGVLREAEEQGLNINSEFTGQFLEITCNSCPHHE